MGIEPEVGSIVEGKVTAITKFGAFVALEGGRSGLVHISEIANTFVNDVHDFLQEGQEVRVRVLASENGKINLSIKKALAQESPAFRSAQRPHSPRPMEAAPRPFQPRPSAPRPAQGRPSQAQSAVPPSGDVDFEEKLKKFLSASEGKMADLNRNVDGKRGGRRRK